ncbi:uncharacterized protein TRIVIDRAFT_175914 [Trichoderma virens Gv29-8]|uniref:WSC domain-containing protein n=1 Tax=Hypocrea virens (strain Gv29-8 / FGSC 10586) TaxID=413071 RepID=G9MDK5_HYPVG|nr:uncharacterized protein TRIVIDRAFT_175914 [Trichoderma virens Gv29-8]EHK27165.1 hypothetical protein TRIVIDRAFT_175914 [Trichoderma virens Gv29-8]UKZ57621.1 hypothetical protein TrVGV298_011481 [Trichoderma virens]
MLVSSSQGLLALAFVVRLCEAAGPRPKMEWDPNTISSCIEWYDNGGTETCEYIRDMFGITPEDFHAWNPSIGLDCKPWYPVSYCILTREKWASFTSTARVSKTTSTTSTTSTSVSTHVPSPTAWEALGCYTDDDPAWPVMEKEYSKEGGDTSLKVSDCQSTCWAASVNRTVLYAGVKEGNQCWCSRFVAGETSRNETDCNLPCSGDKTEICGGKGRLNVFAPVTASESPRSSTTTSVSSIATTAKDSSTSATATDRVTSGSVINSATPSSGAMRYRAMFGLFD